MVTQLGPLFGYTVPRENLTYETFWQWARRLDQVDWGTLAIGVVTIVVLLLTKRRPRIPTALALVVAGSLAVLAFGLDGEGIAVVGHVPGGLAGFDIPPLHWDAVQTLLPAAFGMAGINSHTYTGWGSVTHWNAYVANTQMRGKGTFFDPRLNDPVKFPVATRAGFFDVRSKPDLITSKLPALHAYQLGLEAPKPPAGRARCSSSGLCPTSSGRWRATPIRRSTCSATTK